MIGILGRRFAAIWFVASAVLPAEASGQKTSRVELVDLGASLQEARQSPFHVATADGVAADPGLIVPHSGSVAGLAGSPLWNLQESISDSELQAGTVFGKTLLASWAGHVFALGVLLSCGIDSADNYCESRIGAAAAIAGIIAGGVGIPAFAAGRAGAPWSRAILGSAVGLLGGVVVWSVAGSWGPMLSIPIQAGITTAFSVVS